MKIPIHVPAFVVLFCLSIVGRAEEGMFPVSELGTLNLAEAGMQLSAGQIFSSEEICQVDGVCRVNGCTGSFVSAQGLIITNHHCAYRAIQSSSSAERDLLTNGFHAGAMENEILAKGYEVRVTESFRDCSAEVLAAVKPQMSALERTKVIERTVKEIEAAAEKANPSIRAEVAEMFIGEKYVLFEYTYLRDVRLVFAPPASVGNFGGEIDNWEWPRHTGDFSFMRAYTAPDGSSAEYAPENVPYQPKKFLPVAASGVDEGDFVFLLGYPGRTSRHKTAAFLEYERDVRLPAVVDLYQQQIALMESEGAKDRAVQIKHASRMRSLANVEKRSRGQLKGLVRKALAEQRRKEEQALQTFIDADPVRKEKYSSLLKEIESVYQDMESSFEEEFEFENLVRASRIMNAAFTIVDSAHERAKADIERESAFMERNLVQTNGRLMLGLADLDVNTDVQIIRMMLKRIGFDDAKAKAKEVSLLSRLFALAAERLVNLDIVDHICDMAEESQLQNAEFVRSCLASSVAELKAKQDPVLMLMMELYPEYLELRQLNKKRAGELSRLYGELIDVKKQFAGSKFVPDANATLRLTYGHIKGYSPNDAVVMKPITTLRGVLEKTTGEIPFVTPNRVLEAARNKTYGAFADEELASVPVAILYDTDTTGGNSGSPIMNGKGELVGVNFDRAFEATINDFAWNEAYSRSIGVDIRYVLWITGVVYEASDLLEELGVKP